MVRKNFMSLRGIVTGILFSCLFVFLPREAMGPFVIFVLGIFLGFVCMSLYGKEEGLSLMTLFLVAYALRAFLSTLFYFISFLYQDSLHAGFLFLNDGYISHVVACRMVHMMKLGLSPIQGSIWAYGQVTAPLPYEYWNFYVYSFAGTTPIAMYLVNSFIGALTVFVLYDFIRTLFGRRAAHRAAVLCAFWPSLIFWSTHNLKDPLITFSLTLFVSSLSTILKKPTLLRLASLALSVFIFYQIQSPLLMMAVILAVFSIFVSLKIHHTFWMRTFWVSFFMGAVFAFAMGFIPLSLVTGMMTHFQNYFVRHFDLRKQSTIFEEGFQTINTLRGSRAQGGSAFLKDISISSPLSLLIFLPLLLCYVWLGPFPWQAFGFFKFFSALEMLIFYFLMPAFFRGVRNAFHKERMAAMLTFSTIFTFMLLIALLDSNLGTAFRHRSNIMTLILGFVAVGWKEKKREAVSLGN